MSALLWLIPVAIYIWFNHVGDLRQKETVTAYFWVAIIAIGVLGAI